MSTRTTNTNLQPSLVLPKIVLGTYNKINNLPSNIEQVILLEDISEPKGFNDILNTKKAQIYGFLSRKDIVDAKLIEKVLEIFYKYPMINFVYIDIHKQLTPSFRLPMIEYMTSYQVPVFLKQTQDLFDEHSSVYFNNMILNLSKISIGYQFND